MEREDETFLTGVKKRSKVYETDFDKDIESLKDQLFGIIEKLDEKVSDVIKYHEKDFFAAFKERMLQIKIEMQVLKEKASEQKLKLRHDERLVELEKERDWFRKEALKLDKMCRDAKRQVKKMRTNVENANEDRDFYQTQLLKSKKINKALIIELEKH